MKNLRWWVSLKSHHYKAKGKTGRQSKRFVHPFAHSLNYKFIKYLIFLQCARHRNKHSKLTYSPYLIQMKCICDFKNRNVYVSFYIIYLKKHYSLYI